MSRRPRASRSDRAPGDRRCARSARRRCRRSRPNARANRTGRGSGTGRARSTTVAPSGNAHAIVVQRHFGDAVIANHDARIGDAAAKAVEHGRAAQHEHLALARRRPRCGACRACRPSGTPAPRAPTRRASARMRSRSSRAIGAESDRCLPIETASTSGRCRRRRWRAARRASRPAVISPSPRTITPV